MRSNNVDPSVAIVCFLEILYNLSVSSKGVQCIESKKSCSFFSTKLPVKIRTSQSFFIKLYIVVGYHRASAKNVEMSVIVHHIHETRQLCIYATAYILLTLTCVLLYVQTVLLSLTLQCHRTELN
jgi:hypothetical protein